MPITKVSSININNITKFQSIPVVHIKEIINDVDVEEPSISKGLLINGSDFLLIDNQNNVLLIGE